jgi:hypothetical protein
MKAQRLASVLTVINLVLLLLTAMQAGSTTAQTVTPLLRARALELVDERNVVRMRLNVKEGEIDLFDKNGIIHVKLGASNEGSGLVVADGGTDPASGASAQTYVQIVARFGAGTTERPTTRIMLKGADGRERVITP